MQNIYIFSSDTEIQSKNSDLKFDDKHWNFMQIAIPVTVFHVYFYLMHVNLYKNYILRMNIVVLY